MSIVNKIYRATQGLMLMIQYTRLFDSKEILSGKRLAIVGPASSAYQTNRGDYIDSFDYVIRINKAPLLMRDGKFAADLGTKTDILFHSFFENEFSGGGALNFDLYDTLGIKYVINPIPTFFGKRVTFNFYKKYLLKKKVYTLSKHPYNQAMKSFGKFRPTTGFCALKLVLEVDFSELFITGFTFFKTAYGDGYRDSLKDIDVNKKYIQESNIHNPDIEYEEFKRMLNVHENKRILTDKELKKILKNDGITVNEAS